jgi:enoyl-CoA hydratase
MAEAAEVARGEARRLRIAFAEAMLHGLEVPWLAMQGEFDECERRLEELRGIARAMAHTDVDESIAACLLTIRLWQGRPADAVPVLRALDNGVEDDGDGPMGPTRMRLGKPVLAAIEGHAVAGGLELALWCDLRVAADDAVLGVFCRRWGVPLIDGGTVRLPRLVGAGRAMDLVLTGRPVAADEALRIGLVERVVPSGTALEAALTLAHELAALPQTCLRHDRLSLLEQEGLTEDAALAHELAHGRVSLAEAAAGAARFVAGEGRHGESAQEA